MSYKYNIVLRIIYEYDLLTRYSHISEKKHDAFIITHYLISYRSILIAVSVSTEQMADTF